MTAADTLRRAAMLLRTVYQTVTPPVLAQPAWDHGACHTDELIPATVMHPGVGLALADWLDATANSHDTTVVAATYIWPRAEEADERDAWVAKQNDERALAVARQVLGTTTGQPVAEAHAHPGQAAVLDRVREWANSDVVTATNEFGNGYREALRDIRDLLDGRRLADEAQQPARFDTEDILDWLDARREQRVTRLRSACQTLQQLNSRQERGHARLAAAFPATEEPTR